jgi:hypothetical protein
MEPWCGRPGAEPGFVSGVGENLRMPCPAFAAVPGDTRVIELQSEGR